MAPFVRAVTAPHDLPDSHGLGRTPPRTGSGLGVRPATERGRGSTSEIDSPAPAGHAIQEVRAVQAHPLGPAFPTRSPRGPGGADGSHAPRPIPPPTQGPPRFSFAPATHRHTCRSHDSTPVHDKTMPHS